MPGRRGRGRGGARSGRGSRVASRNRHGNYGIAFRLLRDKLLHEDPLNLDYLSVLTEDNTVVVGGIYDAIGSVFEEATIPFTNGDGSKFDEMDLKPDTVVFANCGAYFTEKGQTKIRNFVNAGGMLVTTDHMIMELDKIFPNTAASGGSSPAHMPKIVLTDDPAVSGFANNWSDTEPQWMVCGGCMPIDIKDKKAVTPVVKDKETGAPLVIRIEKGEGCIYHMISHYAIQRKSIPDAGITTEELFKISCASAATNAELRKCKPDVYDVQSCLTVLEFTLRIILKQRRKWHENKREALPKEIWDVVKTANNSTPKEALPPATAKARMVNLVSACLLNEAKNFESADENRRVIHDLVEEIAKSDAEWTLKLAIYIRRCLNIRSTANFVFATASLIPSVQPLVHKYFSAIVMLPTDLLDVCNLVTTLNEKGKHKLPACIRKGAAEVLASFPEPTLAKYHKKKAKTEGTLSKKKDGGQTEKKEEEEKGEEKEKAPATVAPLPIPFTLKKLVQVLHVGQPAASMMKLLGKRYPENEEAFKASGIEGEFDKEMAGKRMKLPMATTWETQLSAKGNTAEVWEKLLDDRQIGYMAMLRNIRNFLEVGISHKHHQQVIDWLCNEKAVANSKQFPFRFMSCYIEVSLLTLDSLSAPPEEIEEGECVKKHTSKLAVSPEDVKSLKRRQRSGPKVMPTDAILEGYKTSLDNAIKISAMNNVAPLRGRVLVFVDVSGSMVRPTSTFQAPGAMGAASSMRTLRDIALLLGMTINYISEECEVRLFSSPKDDGARADVVFQPKGDSVLRNVDEAQKLIPSLGIGTTFPFATMSEAVLKKDHFDFIIFVSDMMSELGSVKQKGNGNVNMTPAAVCKAYQKVVNPEVKFVFWDVYGAGAKTLEANRQGSTFGLPPKSCMTVCGFSDKILNTLNDSEAAQEKQVDEVTLEEYLPKKKQQPGKKEEPGKST
eukprot:TRINITY_DN9413_c0_g1_i1.p1 TRINITY_DN9413_c0_g1~~TRINITY_DN9413_c0_g1_i1.p1  ORF type:complete len:964 (-),score=123.31 TRINITY_DN9413_c0_g1_i1:140-2995(-)